MDRQAAVKIVKDTFESPFDKGRLINLTKNLVKYLDTSKNFTYQGNIIPDAYEQGIQTLERVGKYEDDEGNKIDVLIVRLKKEHLLERARTMQRNFIAWYLSGSRGGELKDAALVAFVSPESQDWRFSLVRMDYNIPPSPSGRVKVEKELTPARRYSFLVGENESSHTAQVQLLPILQDDERKPLLADLEKAFNIEVVTREFFTKYRDLFNDVREALEDTIAHNPKVKADFEAKGIDPVNFAKKLLGQIVFLYFLQKKGWFGVSRDADWGTGPKDFLRRLFEKKIAPYDNFFNDVLEWLFYEALAVERTDVFYSRFNCKIPFLNGGLFDPINNYDWMHTDILLPSELFSNNVKTDEGDTGTGILDVFDRYNFTVKEDEPLDKEVAVDPEMLGKVFENLLEVKDRKSRGTYYTPREIVHYMCQESLINYLDTVLNTGEVPLMATAPPQGKLFGNPDPQQGTLETPGYRAVVPCEDIEAFVRMGELVIEHDTRVENYGKETERYSYKLPESIRQNAKLIDEKLAQIRVCDPAIGSGAFPVGLMTEIVHARNTLTTYLPDKTGRTSYHFKRHAIQNCLYGVDIDPGAVEIAKLRLWLSLVVDEEDIKQIQPLPNLDYKVVCGNSLLGVERDMFNNELFQKLEELKPLYFDETNARKKQEYRNQIDQLIKKLTNDNEIFDFEVYFSEVFHEKGGFDVVIANPPYIGEKGHKEIFRQTKQGVLQEYYQGKMDIFYFFFHLAIELGKVGAQIAFITTNYYPTATGATRLRKDFKKRTIVRRLINFNELKIFESAQGQHNMITILSKGQDFNAMAKTCITTRKGYANPQILQSILSWQDDQTNYYELPQKGLYEGEQCYIRLVCDNESSDDPVQRILDKVKHQGRELCEFCNINQGIISGADKVTQKHLRNYEIKADIGDGIFVLENQEVKYLELSSAEKKILKPWFKNSDIARWWTNGTQNEYLIYADKRLQNLEGNRLKRHLLKFIDILDHSTDNSPYLHRPRDIDFCGPKIVAPQRSPRNTFGYNEIPWYASADVYFIIQKDDSVNLKYCLALLNSKLYYLWLYFRGKRKGESLELYQVPLSEVPIKKISKVDQIPFISIVDQILAITKDEDYLSNSAKQAKVGELEHQIDQMVYELYGLTPEEIAVVEGKSKENI